MIKVSSGSSPKPPRGGEILAPVVLISELARRRLAALADIAEQVTEIDETLEDMHADAEQTAFDLMVMAGRLQDMEAELDQAA